MAIVQERYKVSPYLLFFLLQSSQVGTGILNFQTKIATGAGQDAWVSVLFVGLSLQVLLFMGLIVIKNSSGENLASFHIDVFGKFIGKTLNVGLVFYFLLTSFLSLYNYVDLLQTFGFERIPAWELTFGICLVLYYIVLGGFRVVTGVAFWGVVLPLVFIPPFLITLQYLELENIMPFFNHGVKDYVISGKESIFMFMGFECVFIYYPFIKKGDKTAKWAHLGLLATTLLYFVLTILTFLYYTQGKLLRSQWATLTMIKVISFTIVESFEFIFIFVFFIVIVSSGCILLWSATRTLKISFNFKPSWSLFGILLAFFLLNIGLENIMYGRKLNGISSYIGLFFLYFYIPFLFIVSLVKKRIGRKRGGSEAT
ncbi:GerAB/ArcD/ProY family transporter [Neobacillus notoginsengisoli]|nr:GerAB/ArcD/ProY family transporter [Neobacillus notoginsengisoli]